MPQMRFIHIGRPLRPVDWVIVFLILALIAGVAIALIVVALGILLFLAPVLAVVGLSYYLLWRMRLRAAMRKWRNNIVEGEYRVVDPDESKSLSPSVDQQRDT
jgi:high-affinity Fe2+/Pb2+ permease